MSLLIKGGTLVTMNPDRSVFKGDLLVDGNRITKISKSIKPKQRPKKTIDASGKLVIPGLIQAHVHLCQILFRGEADDLALLDWLKKKIWPMENAHTASSASASANLGLLEMLKCGTTSILDMGTVKHTHSILEAAEASGIRYWGGKCLMDEPDRSGPLFEKTASALSETDELISEWVGRNSRVRYVLSPRFVVSCTEALLRECKTRQAERGLLIHTHASESKDEIALVRKLTGKGNVEYLNSLGLMGNQTVLVHGVHLSDSEVDMFAETETGLVHCPAANLKLASGIAPIKHYLDKGVRVGLGCDGAPCNNTMDPFIEARLCAWLQKPEFGPTALPAPQAFELATLGGARVLGMESELGSLEVGKLADIAIVELDHPSTYTVSDPYSALIYSCTGRDVSDVVVDGQVVIRNRVATTLDEDAVLSKARSEKAKLLRRL